MHQLMPKSIQEIDKAIGGISLSSDETEVFEKALNEFIEESQGNSQILNETVKNMSKLLEISSDNFKKVKNQKWFKRVWNTVTGENKRLLRMNQQNLLRVQKGACYFLINLASQNQMIMQSIYFTLQRLKTVQIENERLKIFMLLVAKRLTKIEKEVEGINIFTKLKNWLIYFRRRRIIAKNIKILPLVKKSIRERYQKVIDNSIRSIVSPLMETNAQLRQIANFLSKAKKRKIKSAKIADAIEKSLNVTIPDKRFIASRIERAFYDFEKIHNELVNVIVEKYSPTNSFEIETRLDLQYRQRLSSQLSNIFNPILKELNGYEKMREHLLELFPKYKEFTTENPWVRGIKEFTRDTILGPIGIIWSLSKGYKAQKIFEEFNELWENYIEKWDSLSTFTQESAIPNAEMIFGDILDLSMGKLDLLWEDFNQRALPLREVYEDLTQL